MASDVYRYKIGDIAVTVLPDGFRMTPTDNYLANASKEERDDFVAKYSGMKPELVAAVNLPEYTTEFNVPSLKANLDIAVRQKLAKPFDLDVMIWKP